MKNKLYLLVIIFSTLIYFYSPLTATIKKSDLNAYLAISFQNPAMFKDSITQNKIKLKINNIFKDEGVKIIPYEDPGKYEDNKLYINIYIRDSLEINAKRMAVDMSLIVVKYPGLIAPYKNDSDIYNAVKNYIRKTIIGHTR